MPWQACPTAAQGYTAFGHGKAMDRSGGSCDTGRPGPTCMSHYAREGTRTKSDSQRLARGSGDLKKYRHL
jgi:hypothetical protein